MEKKRKIKKRIILFLVIIILILGGVMLFKIYAGIEVKNFNEVDAKRLSQTISEKNNEDITIECKNFENIYSFSKGKTPSFLRVYVRASGGYTP